MSEFILVVVGALAATVAWVLPSVLSVLVLRQSLRRLDRVQRECDDWRQAAANATVAARVASATTIVTKCDDEGEGEDWKTAG